MRNNEPAKRATDSRHGISVARFAGSMTLSCLESTGSRLWLFNAACYAGFINTNKSGEATSSLLSVSTFVIRFLSLTRRFRLLPFCLQPFHINLNSAFTQHID